MSAPCILVAAFEPFGGETVNPAAEAAALLPQSIGGYRIETLLLPVTYAGCFAPLADAMDRLAPAAVVCLGQAGGRDAITPERVAVNLSDAAAPDSAGLILTDAPVVPDAPAAYFSTLPVKQMCREMAAAGILARVSYSAGTYVCNRLFYLLMRRLDTKKSACPGGFVHIPYLPAQAANRKDAPSLPLDDIVRGLTAALSAVAAALKPQ